MKIRKLFNILLQPTLMVDEPVTDTEGLALKPGIKSPHMGILWFEER